MKKYFKLLAGILCIQMLAVSPQVHALEPRVELSKVSEAKSVKGGLAAAVVEIDAYGRLYVDGSVIAYHVDSFIKQGDTLVFADRSGTLYSYSWDKWTPTMIATDFKEYFVAGGFCYFTRSDDSLYVVTNARYRGEYRVVARDVAQVFFDESHVSYTTSNGYLYIVTNPERADTALVSRNATYVLMGAGRMVFLEGSTLYEVTYWTSYGTYKYISSWVEQVVILSNGSIQYNCGGSYWHTI